MKVDATEAARIKLAMFEIVMRNGMKTTKEAAEKVNEAFAVLYPDNAPPAAQEPRT
jgi:hypothetical protein